MKELFAAGLSAIALVATAAPAQAATDLGTVTLSNALPGPDFLSQIFFINPTMVAGEYFIKYAFSFPASGVGAGNLSTNLVAGTNTIFNKVDLNGTLFSLGFGDTHAQLDSAPVFASPPDNLLTADFTVLKYGVGQFNGSVSATALPEPGTWAMMLVGFGMIGFGLRRSHSKVTTRVRYSMA